MHITLLIIFLSHAKHAKTLFLLTLKTAVFILFAMRFVLCLIPLGKD